MTNLKPSKKGKNFTDELNVRKVVHNVRLAKCIPYTRLKDQKTKMFTPNVFGYPPPPLSFVYGIRK